MKHLDRTQEKYIERELNRYGQNRAYLETMRDSVLETGLTIRYDTDRVSGGGISKPTEQQAEKLITSTAAIQYTSLVVEAIDGALKELPQDIRRFFDLKYRDKKGIVDVCNALPCSETTYHRYRRQLVTAVAVKLGLIGM